MAKELNPAAVKIGAWLYKIDFLKDEINKLEKLESFPIIRISVFLLKSQLIEFELEHQLYSIDFYLYAHNNSKLIKREVRTPKKLDQLTLRKLVNEYKQLRGKELVELNTYLKRLVDLRDNFTHHLFSIDKNTKKMSDDSDRGIEIANKVLTLIKDLDSKLS